MCLMSTMVDRTKDKWSPYIVPGETFKPFVAPATQADIDRLREEFRKDIEELKELIKAAKIIDKALGQEDCESDEKVAALKKIAELLGVELEDIF